MKKENIQWNIISDDFNNGTSVSELSRKYGVSYGKINKYLIDNNIKSVKHYKLSNEKYNEIIKLILDKKTLNEISKIMNTNDNTVRIIANENGLTVEKGKPQRSDNNKNFKDDYFKTIDTEAKAYFLGLIYTDGNIRIRNEKRYFLSIELHKDDVQIIEKLKNELCCGNKIYFRDRITQFGEGHTARFETCNSETLINDLSIFDVIPDKTQKSVSFKNIIEYIPKHLIRHFLRGLIDGDGSISLRSPSNNQNSVSFIHPHKECCEYYDFLMKYLLDDSLFDYTMYKKESHLWNIRYRRINDVKRICELLYKDANFYIERKYERAKRYYDEDYYKSQIDGSFLIAK